MTGIAYRKPDLTHFEDTTMVGIRSAGFHLLAGLFALLKINTGNQQLSSLDNDCHIL